MDLHGIGFGKALREEEDLKAKLLSTWVGWIAVDS